MPDAPIQLVKPDPHHKHLTIVEENMKYLQQIDAPIVIISVVGPFHSGKSFLMNQLMKKSSGFGVGPSVKPTTMGIWMWGQPSVMRAPNNNQQINVIFLDTEGFAANNVSENYDAKIFAVTTLLSSHLLFNSVKIINQADIDYLEVLSRQTQLFALRSQMSKSKWLESLNEDLLHFPPLTWVVQDFVQETESGETATQWLHRLMSTHIRENDDYKVSLLDIFSEVDCHTLFLPATKKSVLQNLSGTSDADLTPEYREERDHLIRKIESKLRPKSRAGRNINGAELSFLLQVIVKAANEGNLASVPSRWESFMENLLTSSVTACVKFYDDEMKNSIQDHGIHDCVKASVLQTHHHSTLKRSHELLTNLLRGLPNTSVGHQKLTNLITLSYENIQTLNSKRVENRIIILRQEAEVSLEEKLNSIDLPIPSETLEEKAARILDPIYSDCVQKISLILEDDAISSTAAIVSNSLGRILSALKSKNQDRIHDYFMQIIAESMNTFNRTVDEQWSKEEPLTPSLLSKVKTMAREDATVHYTDATREYSAEKLEAVMSSHLKQEISRHEANMDLENEKLALKYISSAADKSMKMFSDKTKPDIVQMPRLDEELLHMLENEKANAVSLFQAEIKEFTSYDTYSEKYAGLLEQLSEMIERRKKENIDAYTKEVLGPLEDAVPMIVISESRYSNAWSFSHFIESVYFEVLKKGKAATWPDDLKHKIIHNFVENDATLSKLTASKRGFWPNIYGFFEMLFWFLSKIFQTFISMLSFFS